MEDKVELRQGMRVKVLGTDNSERQATVEKINYAANTVTSRWYGRKHLQSKEDSFKNVLLLNPEYKLTLTGDHYDDEVSFADTDYDKSVYHEFLRGCKIFVCDSDKCPNLMDCVNNSGAQLLVHLDRCVTHVVVPLLKLPTEVQDFIKDLDQKPFIVTANWILDSAGLGNPADESKYAFDYIPAENTRERQDEAGLAAGMRNLSLEWGNASVHSNSQAGSENELNRNLESDNESDGAEQNADAGALVEHHGGEEQEVAMRRHNVERNPGALLEQRHDAEHEAGVFVGHRGGAEAVLAAPRRPMGRARHPNHSHTRLARQKYEQEAVHIENRVCHICGLSFAFPKSKRSHDAEFHP